MFKRFLSWLRQVMNRMVNFKSVADVVPETIISNEMANEIDLWINAYQGKCPWLQKDSRTLGLPSQIAGEIARLVTLEMEMTVSGDNDRAKLIEEAMEPVLKNIRNYVEYACAGGGLAFKPCVVDGKIQVDFHQANQFLPTAFDSSGRITGAAFMDHKTEGDKHFTRVEKHAFIDGKYVITNVAYRSHSPDSIGSECPLSDYHEWKDIQPQVEITNAVGALFSYFRIPLGNTIDPSSPLGVSVYSRALKNRNIEEADKQFQRFMWEFEAGEMAIDAAEDAFKMEKGKPIVPKGRERLFRINNLDTVNGGEAMKAWTPTLREQSFLNGLEKILIVVEDNCGLSRGTLSNHYTDARTAEEIKQTKQRSYANVTDIQKALESALEDLVAAINQLADLYSFVEGGKYELAFKWDDSIITDAKTEREIDRQDVRDGFMLPWEYRAKWYGEDEKAAKAKLAELEEPTDDEILGFNKEPEETEE